MKDNENMCGLLEFQNPQPTYFTLNGQSGTLMIIHADGTLEVDNLKPANETAKEVLKFLVRWLPRASQIINNPTVVDDIVDRVVREDDAQV